MVLELAGLLVFAEGSQGEPEGAGCAQRVGVVVAQNSTAAGVGIVVEMAGLLVLAEGSHRGPGDYG